MLTSLIEKRNQLFADYDKLKSALVAEKRAAFNNEELESVNKIKLDIAEIDKQIAVEKEIEEKRNAKLDAIAAGQAPAIITNKNTIETEFRNLVMDGRGKMSISFNDLEKRATVTTSTNSHFKFTDQNDGLSIDQKELVLESLGAKKYFFDHGAIDFPSITNIVGTFAGSEGGSISDATLTSAKKTLTPTFVSASLEVTKAFISQSKAGNIQDLMAELRYGIDKAVEAKALNSMSGLTAVSSGSTLYASVLNMEAAINGAGTGYIFSASGTAKAKASKKDSGSGEFVWMNGFVNGYSAKRSTLMGNTDYAYYGDFKSVALAYWGDVQIEIISDSTLARAGKVLIIASAMADGSYLDANKVSVLKNVSAHS